MVWVRTRLDPKQGKKQIGVLENVRDGNRGQIVVPAWSLKSLWVLWHLPSMGLFLPLALWLVHSKYFINASDGLIGKMRKLGWNEVSSQL